MASLASHPAPPKSILRTSSGSNTENIASSVEDTALFGSLNASIADHLMLSITNALHARLSTLPPLEGNAVLQQRLLDSYSKNVDILELWTARNIFSVRSFSNAQAIVEAYHSNNDIVTPQPLADFVDNNSSHASTTSITITSKDIPTLEQMSEIESDTKKLREQLKQLKRRRAELALGLQELTATQEMAESVHLTVPNVDFMEQSTKLQHLQQVGTAMIEQLDEQKHARDNDSDLVVVAVVTKKKKTLEEQYEADRVAASTDILQHLYTKIKPNSNK